MYWSTLHFIDYYARHNNLGLLLVIILLGVGITWPSHANGIEDERVVNSLLMQGDWLYESDAQLGFLHINQDKSYSHVVIDLNNHQNSYHHWGRVTVNDDKLLFRPSEIAFSHQNSAMIESDSDLKPTQDLKSAADLGKTENAFIAALLAQTIHYTLSSNAQQLILSIGPNQNHPSNQLYQAFEPHHTFGYWPDDQSADMSYLIIFPNNYYAHIYSNLEQVTATKFEFGQLF